MVNAIRNVMNLFEIHYKFNDYFNEGGQTLLQWNWWTSRKLLSILWNKQCHCYQPSSCVIVMLNANKNDVCFCFESVQRFHLAMWTSKIFFRFQNQDNLCVFHSVSNAIYHVTTPFSCVNPCVVSKVEGYTIELYTKTRPSILRRKTCIKSPELAKWCENYNMREAQPPKVTSVPRTTLLNALCNR